MTEWGANAFLVGLGLVSLVMAGIAAHAIHLMRREKEEKRRAELSSATDG